MSEQIDIPIRQVREAQVECKISKIPGHGVVDRTPGKDHLRVVADLFCLLDKVVGVNRDTMAADHAGLVGMEVPPGAGSPEHFLGADAQKGEDYQELVHDVDGDPDDILHIRNIPGLFTITNDCRRSVQSRRMRWPDNYPYKKEKRPFASFRFGSLSKIMDCQRTS